MAHTTGYRAVSQAEFADILATHEFRVGPNSMEGKWFSDTLTGASAHGHALYPNGDFKLIAADLPDDAPSLFTEQNIDGKGPGRYLAIEDLCGVVPRAVE